MYVRTQRLVIRGAPAKNPRKNRPGARGGKGAGIAFVGGACAGTPPARCAPTTCAVRFLSPLYISDTEAEDLA